MMTCEIHLHVCSYAGQDWLYSSMTFYTQYIVKEIDLRVAHSALCIQSHLCIPSNRGRTETLADLALGELANGTNCLSDRKKAMRIN